MNLQIQQSKFWDEIADSLLYFIVDNEVIRKYIHHRFLRLMQLIAQARKQSHSPMEYFDVLEKISFKIIEVVGIEKLCDVFSTEAGWLKTELKNKLNMICFEAYDAGLEEGEF